jgi:tetratricopeptide (TPR) repeat protein
VTTQDLPTRELGAPEGVAVDPPGEDSAEEELGQGDFVGRYSVLSCLGRGGMGVVYKAYDPQLDRNVALKLLRRGRSSVTADLRLLREAQTLAKLKHPNVVAVYDAGLTNHGVFLAMELLTGKTVNEWLEQRTRSVREVLDVFRAAGKGLLAAHEAGFVHRDFKPGNVIVEDDGSVRVLDFGLAYLLDDPSSGRDLRSTGAQDGSGCGPDEPFVARPISREVFATEAGLVIGTPAYMAPEQIVGDRGDHRSEQFAFAMSLYVSLYDRSPLAGETYEERRENIQRGVKISERDLERSASGEIVPARVRHVILRGLSHDPASRYASMTELLVELEEPQRRGRWAAIVAFTLMAGFGVGAMVFDAPAEPPCSDPAAALEGTWSPEDRAAVEIAFAADEEVGARVGQALDDYGAAWVEMYERSCRATFVTRQQSEWMFDQRMRCLERRRNRLRSTIDALLEADSPQMLEERTLLAFRLPGLEPCADLDALAAEKSLPDDPELRRKVVELRGRLDLAETRYEAHDLAQCIALATAAVAEARSLDHPPVLAEALVMLGRAHNAGQEGKQAEATLREAILVAAKAGAAQSEAIAWTELLMTDVVLGQTEVGVARELAAQAAVERAGDEVVRSWLLNSLGVLYSENNEPERSREYLRQALEAKQATLGPRHVDVGISWYNLGNALADYGLHDEARQAFEQSRSIYADTVGLGHPLAHYAIHGLCRVEQAQGRAEQAARLCTEALADGERSGMSPLWMSRVGFSLARAQWDLGSAEDARRTGRLALERAAEEPQLVEQIERWLADPERYVDDPEEPEEPEGAVEGQGEAPAPAPVPADPQPDRG